MKVTVILIVIGTLGTVTKGLVKELEDLEIPNNSIVEISQNFEKNSRDLRRLVVERPSANSQISKIMIIELS